MFNHTITLFNFHAATGCWYPSVINGADLIAVDSKNASTTGRTNSDSVELIINCSVARVGDSWLGPVKTGNDLYIRQLMLGHAPNDAVKGKNIQTSAGWKCYISPKAYAKCINPGECITFTPESDFFIDGDWEELTPILDEDYDSGLYNELNEQRDGVYMLTSAVFYELIPHFEIGGR